MAGQCFAILLNLNNIFDIWVACQKCITRREVSLLQLLCFEMNSYLERISKELDVVHIAHTMFHDCIHIKLPNEFGMLEIKVWGENDDSIQIIDGDFHTHGELEAIEFGLRKEKAIAQLVNKLFTGEYLLIEETEPNKQPRKLVAQSFDDYLKYLPKGTEYRIANKT